MPLAIRIPEDEDQEGGTGQLARPGRRLSQGSSAPDQPSASQMCRDWETAKRERVHKMVTDCERDDPFKKLVRKCRAFRPERAPRNLLARFTFSKPFVGLTMLVIMLNAFVIAAETDAAIKHALSVEE